MQSLHFLHPLIFVTDFWFRYSFQKNFTILFLYLSSVKRFYTKIVCSSPLIIFIFFSWLWRNIVMNSLARARFFKTVFTTELTAQMKSLLAALSLHNVCYVCLQTWRKPKKDTLIAAFFRIISYRYKSLTVHEPFKRGGIILSYLTLQFKVFRYSLSKTSPEIFQTP